MSCSDGIRNNVGPNTTARLCASILLESLCPATLHNRERKINVITIIIIIIIIIIIMTTTTTMMMTIIIIIIIIIIIVIII